MHGFAAGAEVVQERLYKREPSQFWAFCWQTSCIPTVVHIKALHYMQLTFFQSWVCEHPKNQANSMHCFQAQALFLHVRGLSVPLLIDQGIHEHTMGVSLFADKGS